MMRPPSRRGLSLLEVMISAAILVVALTLVVQIQAQAVESHLRAEKVQIGTQLAQDKLGEVLLYIEANGIESDEMYERGDFDDFGGGPDGSASADFGNRLDDYEWEWWVEEIDFALAPGLFGMMGGAGGADDPTGGGGMGGMPGGAGAADPFAGLPFGPEMITEQLSPFTRILRVRVTWGPENSEDDLARGDGIEVTTHLFDPAGSYRAFDPAGDPNNPNAGGPGGMPPGGRPPRGRPPGGMPPGGMPPGGMPGGGR